MSWGVSRWSLSILVGKVVFRDLQGSDTYLSHSLNSLKGGYMGDYIGDYYRGYSRSLDYSAFRIKWA